MWVWVVGSVCENGRGELGRGCQRDLSGQQQEVNKGVGRQQERITLCCSMCRATTACGRKAPGKR
jgi:hypothetical protein